MVIVVQQHVVDDDGDELIEGQTGAQPVIFGAALSVILSHFSGQVGHIHIDEMEVLLNDPLEISPVRRLVFNSDVQLINKQICGNTFHFAPVTDENIDSLCPLEKETIRQALISILAIKNRPQTNLPDGTDRLFDYLRGIGMIEGDNILTDKGMVMATSGVAVKVNWLNAGLTILIVLGSLASIWGVLPKA